MLYRTFHKMKPIQNRFLRSLTLLTVILAVLGVSLTILFPTLMNPHWVWLLLLFTGITPTLFFVMTKVKEQKFNKFTNYFMVSSMLKLLLLLVLILAYAFINKAEAVSFTITLLLLYCSHLVFEIYWLLQLSKQKK